MNTLFSNLASAGKNPHVSIPLIVGIAMSVAEIWLPESYQPKLQKTEKVLFAYGIIAAANSGPTKPEDKDQEPDEQKS